MIAYSVIAIACIVCLKRIRKDCTCHRSNDKASMANLLIRTVYSNLVGR